MWSLDQVALHNKPTDCWVIIKDCVYDVTEFLQEHPGGSRVILQYAGRDATSAYEPIHPSDALEKNLPLSKHLGPLFASAAQSTANDQQNRNKTKDELRVEQALLQRPPLARILSVADMEDVARKVLSIKAEAYYSSAADDHITTTENARAFSRFFFHPRVLRPVAKCDASTTMLGFNASLPVFASSAAMARLGHPLGEINISKGAATTGIIQIVSSNASISYAEIIHAVPSSQPLFFQLYKFRDDAAAEKRVREAEQLGYKAIFLTVDTLVLGNREKDRRSRWVTEDLERGYPEVYVEGAEEAALPAFAASGAGMMAALADLDMSWERTIPWLRSITKLPLVIKGIQCVEDAVLAANAGVDGILLSNHGGRQLEYSLPPIEVLYRLRKQRPDIFDKLEVYVEGGVQRGTDVLKALCLGATAVGLGRPFLYAQSAYGEAGVVKIVQILEREIISGMRGLGVASVKDLKPEMVERVDWQPLLRGKL
ncbi:FMN-dependent dehydrogenase-domain-containing protein [Mycena sanguinolenta]|nr:FMN-dependent dehydrogenase-domain-containing protein [Mycena sanguinolenta]